MREPTTEDRLESSLSQCIVCGTTSQHLELAGAGVSVVSSAGAASSTSHGQTTHMHCRRCDAEYAYQDEALVVGTEVYVLHLSVCSMNPPITYLITGPFWDNVSQRRTRPGKPTETPQGIMGREPEDVRALARSILQEHSTDKRD